jgi:hypothetical protein
MPIKAIATDEEEIKLKITKEGKEINEKNQNPYYSRYYRLCNQTPQLPIQFIFKPITIPKKANPIHNNSNE